MSLDLIKFVSIQNSWHGLNLAGTLKQVSKYTISYLQNFEKIPWTHPYNDRSRPGLMSIPFLCVTLITYLDANQLLQRMKCNYTNQRHSVTKRISERTRTCPRYVPSKSSIVYRNASRLLSARCEARVCFGSKKNCKIADDDAWY